jgi:hypothetical protein
VPGGSTLGGFVDALTGRSLGGLQVGVGFRATATLAAIQRVTGLPRRAIQAATMRGRADATPAPEVIKKRKIED